MWNPKNLLRLSVPIIAQGHFSLFLKHIYEQKPSWMCFSIPFLMLLAIVLFFGWWTFAWIFGGAVLLILLVVMWTKLISVPTSWRKLSPIVLIFANILFTIMLLEVTLRFVPQLLTEGARLRVHWWEGGERWYVPHPYIGHLHTADGHASSRTARPGLEQMSEHDPWGFRNRWPWPEQADILALGDSFTYSQMVDEEQSWTTMLAGRLPHSRILNLGLIGGAPQQYLRIYETFGIDLRPKLLLIGLFLGNDLWGAGEFDRWWKSGDDGPFPEFRRLGPRSGIRSWVALKMKRFYLSALLQDLQESYRAGRLFSGKTLELSSGGRLQLVPSILVQMATYAQHERFQYTIVLETIEQIHTLAQENHSHCLILFFPSKEEVYLPVLGEKAADLAAPFIPELERRGMSYLDLGPLFRRHAATGEQLFFEVDGHPNARGYALIAEAIFAHIEENSRKYSLDDPKRPSRK
jgi:lysophospholipase L1-like esterase